MVDMWIRDFCPKCKASNFVDNGDMDDITAMDVEGIICHNCGHKWLLHDDIVIRDEDDEEPSVNYELGRDFVARD